MCLGISVYLERAKTLLMVVRKWMEVSDTVHLYDDIQLHW